ncbi:serum deprivation-response protein-like [Sinocyclocheilus anshuiensis]|uniref:Serum deprivation-response protein-like n=1 Tax=Sinocyclocheilus anshuiensis TaxID=1608454 RepID=A0A671K767_9TELE|nr:PREDICTED: serum deprivation-response protein-like [Sinocyclocheilus anshuiensis]
MGEDAVQAERSSMASTHENQELVVPSPSPTQSSPTHSLSHLGTVATNAPSGEPSSPGPLAGGTTGTLPRDGASPTSQVNAITVLTLLDKLVNMLDTVQENQHKMETRQVEIEGAVRGIQNDMTKLSKSHTSTSNTVSKLLEKSRKVSVHMKEVKDKMDKQAVQVKKLEANHAQLIKRDNFKVLIFQEENEIPSSVFVKEPAPLLEVEENANRSQEEGLQTITLSSDEEQGPEEDEDEILAILDLESESRVEKSRAEKIKSSSLKKVDSLKKAFSRQNIEKKMNKFSTKIVSPEQREKIKKSLTPNHQKNPSAKSSSFKVSPLTFNIKKNRSGDADPEAEASAQSESPVASIELAPIESPTEDLSFREVHSQLAPAQEETVKAAVEAMEKEEVPNILNGTAEVELSITEDVSEEYALSVTLPQDASKKEVSHNALQGDDEEEGEQEEGKESEDSPLAAAAGQAEGVAVGQAS